MIVQQGANKIVAGKLTLTGSAGDALPAMACKRVWVCAAQTDTYGGVGNGADAFAGAPDSGGTPRYARRIAAADKTGVYIHVTHTRLVSFKGTAADVLDYWIEV